jgi:hypothetical protein
MSTLLTLNHIPFFFKILSQVFFFFFPSIFPLAVIYYNPFSVLGAACYYATTTSCYPVAVAWQKATQKKRTKGKRRISRFSFPFKFFPFFVSGPSFNLLGGMAFTPGYHMSTVFLCF